MLLSSLSQEEIAKLTWQTWSYVRVLVVIIHNLYCIPCYLVLTNIILYPLYHYEPSIYWQFENILYNWLLYVVASWSFGAGIHITECGDDIYSLVSNVKDGKRPKIMILVNHQSTADVPLMMQAFLSKSTNILLWVMDKQFKLTNFGAVSATHCDYFLDTKKFQAGTLKEHCTKNNFKDTIILFPEGGFRWKRVASSNRYAVSKGLPSLFHVTYPRFGAFQDVMDKSVGVTHVVDLTIFYEDIKNPPSILDIARGHRQEHVYFYYQVFENNETIDEQWVTKKWIEKEQMMKQYYSERSVLLQSINASKGSLVTLSWLKVCFIHIFYLSFWFLAYRVYKHFY